MPNTQQTQIDLLIAAVAFTIQAAVDLDGEVSNERVNELRSLEQRLMANIQHTFSPPIALLTYDLSYAMGHLINTARKQG